MTTENNALIEEMLARAEPVQLPSDLTDNPVINRGITDVEPPTVVHEVQSGKYFYIYETDTGDRVPCLGYMLRQKLTSRFPNGKYRFSVDNPGVIRKRGTIKCLLHPESSDRESYEELGFRTCPKSNITNRHQLTEHMRKRHPQEWKAIEAARVREERDEDRAFQRGLLEAVGRPEASIVPPIVPRTRRKKVKNG
jgi:hypothetical protein